MPGGPASAELKMDPRGTSTLREGALGDPLLGDLSLLVIESLPEEKLAQWDEFKTVSLAGDPGHPGRRGHLRSGSAGPALPNGSGVAASGDGRGGHRRRAQNRRRPPDRRPARGSPRGEACGEVPGRPRSGPEQPR